MDIFTQRKFLLRFVILLTAMNLTLIGALIWKDFFRKPPLSNQQNENRDVSVILEKKLKLTKDQVELIKDIRKGFIEKEKELSASIRSERDSINAILFSNSADEQLVKTFARRVAENDYKMELLRFEQAQVLKAICTPEQLQKFEGLALEIRDFFRQDNKPQRK